MGLSNELSCEAGSFLLLLPQPPQVFSISGLRLYFPTELELWDVQSAPQSTSCCLAGQLQLCLLCSTISCWVCQPLPTPPTGVDECFSFVSLVVGLSYSLIFCQFWLFFVFKLLWPFFWLCKEAQCVYLCLHLGWKSAFIFLFLLFISGEPKF